MNDCPEDGHKMLAEASYEGGGVVLEGKATGKYECNNATFADVDRYTLNIEVRPCKVSSSCFFGINQRPLIS